MGVIALGMLGIAGALGLAAGPATAAGTGYGPVATGPVGVPGGFSAVVRTATLPPSGGKVAARIAGDHLEVSVPPHAFGTRVEVEVTAPDLHAVDHALGALRLQHFVAVSGVGLAFLAPTGRAFTGRFRRAIIVTLRGPLLGLRGERAIEITGRTRFVRLPTALGAHRLTLSISSDPDVVVLRPTAPPHARPHATRSSTAVEAAPTEAGQPSLRDVVAVGPARVRERVLDATDLGWRPVADLLA